jgi:hypothetical protein
LSLFIHVFLYFVYTSHPDYIQIFYNFVPIIKYKFLFITKKVFSKCYFVKFFFE